jgi:hypothetical protein
VELGIVDRASDSTIGRTLKKTFSSRIADSAGSSRRRPTSAFVAAMEDVLAVYTRPYDPDRPLVCVGRDLKATHCRDAPANPDETGAPGSCRLRIRAQRHRQPCSRRLKAGGTSR